MNLTIEQLQFAREIGATHYRTEWCQGLFKDITRTSYWYWNPTLKDWGLSKTPAFSYIEQIDFTPLDQQNREETMKNIKPRDCKFFGQVAEVIGEDAAEVEIQRVIDSGIAVRASEADLCDSFAWVASPQGHEFWSDIESGRYPTTESEEVTPTVETLPTQDITYQNLIIDGVSVEITNNKVIIHAFNGDQFNPKNNEELLKALECIAYLKELE